MGNSSISGTKSKAFDWFTTYLSHIFESYNSGPDLPEDTFHPFTQDEWVIPHLLKWGHT